MIESSRLRVDTPVRKSFVRNESSQPPLAAMFRKGGRGPATAIKLYLALLWRCSAKPFSTDISARQWATLLNLPDPSGAGARRITDAYERLEDLHLIRLEKRRGEATLVHILEESGSGSDYTLPAGRVRRGHRGATSPHLYFKVPQALWTTGHMQDMSGPALAMLLILLAEQATTDNPRWWSTEAFPRQYQISPTVRSRGTRDLIERRLLTVKKHLIEGPSDTFGGRERVRNSYALIGYAAPGARPSIAK